VFHFTACFKEAEPALAPQAELGGLRILLAEDNAVNQYLALSLLKQQQHQVTVVTNGLEALTALQGQAFDVVLMDMQMPEMDGIEATLRIRESERRVGGHIPIIAITANAMKGDRERCVAAGMDDYVSKPLNKRELFAALARVQGP
jgi:CheY-like chemotaxis protein